MAPESDAIAPPRLRSERRTRRLPSSLTVVGRASSDVPRQQSTRGRHWTITLLLAGLLCSAVAARAAQKRPNILFLFSDDQRADTIHALGNSSIQTPHLDKLVAAGTVFTRAFCMGGMQGAICAPSRAMLMSGRTLFRVDEHLKGQTTWPEQFARAGYRTFATGKWHNGAESLLRSFQNGKAIFLGGMGNPYSLPVQDITTEHRLTPKRPSGTHATELFANSAIDFLEHQRETDPPFLLYVAFTAPHDPRIAPPAYHDRYNAHQPPLPPDYMPFHPFNNGEMTIRDEKLAPWPRTPAVVRQHLADYYSAITFLDDQVGRILEALRRTGQFERTIIVYSSDHGLAIGSHGLMGKQNLYDHSMHAPLIFAGPGISAGRRSDALCYLLDIFPTLGQLADVTPPPGNEGLGLGPIISGRTDSTRSEIFTAYRNVQRAVRDDRWKLIRYPRINKSQLFDLHNDPHELANLADDPKWQAKTVEMMGRLRTLQSKLGDECHLTSEHPEPAAWSPDLAPPIK